MRFDGKIATGRRLFGGHGHSDDDSGKDTTAGKFQRCAKQRGDWSYVHSDSHVERDGGNASVPTIKAAGSCTVGTVSNGGLGAYEATVTMTKRTGTCRTTANWTANIEYAATAVEQTTAAEKSN